MRISLLSLQALRRFSLPAGILVALLQRTPAVRMIASADERAVVSSIGAVLKSVAGTLASLGAVHSLAGATTFIAVQGQTIIVRNGDPPAVNIPVNATVGVPIPLIVFTVTGATAQPGSFEITNLPPGLSIQGVNPAGLLNASSGLISGTPTTVGTFNTSILAWEFAGGPGTPGNDTFGPTTIQFVIAPGASAPPSFTTQPQSQSTAVGGGVTFSVAVTGSPPPTYQWRRNGVNIVGANAASLTLANVQAADAGNYTVFVSNSAGNATSNVATLTLTPVVDQAARLTNLSVRTAMGANQTLIVGVVVNDGTRDVLVRAAGPALAAFGLSTAMTDPRLDLFNGPDVVFSNNDWPATLAPMFASVGAFSFPIGSRDAAFVQSINAAYSIQARGTGPGVVLVEAYDTGAASAARLVNVSARNRVGTGDDIMIAGFNIAGTGAKPLLIRAIGPQLTAFGVGGVLADPKLEIYDSAGVKMTENDNWAPSLAAAFQAVGAFALNNNSRDAALLVSLPPGSYTAQVRGADGGTGEALIEIYEGK